MASLQLKSLVNKLNDPTRRCLESAAGLCLSRTHFHVEIEHWLLKLLDEADGDLPLLLRHFDIDIARFQSVAEGVLDKMRTGNGRAPALSNTTVELIKAAWMLASVQYAAPQVRSGHLLAAIVRDPLHFEIGAPLVRLLDGISADAITDALPVVTTGSVEARASLPTSFMQSGNDSAPANADGAPSKTPSLDRYTADVTQQARDGKIDPVLGRDAEIRQLMDILLRRRQNNPILTGEPGVGKTAVVEGFALKVVTGDVPEALQNITIRSLDLGQLEAGAGVKGEFENRLKSILNEIQASPTPIILMIDEAHTLIGAGAQAGGGDAANLLKPALARGELRTIAATTWSEYKKYFEQDAALTRRFQVVKVEEPSLDVAKAMLRGVANKLEQHHGVRILDDAIDSAVTLSSRYITGRQLPDKAVSVLDTACARIAISQNSTPGAIEDARAKCERIRRRSDRLRDEQSWGADHGDQLSEMNSRLEQSEAELAELEARWHQEKFAVKEILQIKDQIHRKNVETTDTLAKPDDRVAKNESDDASSPLAAMSLTELQAELTRLEADLDDTQGEEPLMYVDVDSQSVASTISAWTGIPLGRMSTDQTTAVLNLKQRLEESVVGQSHALDEIARHIRTSRAGLGDPNKPIGVFMLAGTSGVGKTETALALADTLYGGTQQLTTINMSEFKEEHKVSLLMGSPPGYVGYGEGGVLTEAVRRKPYSVILLDELEKAHPGVQDVFYQVFDKGQMKDGQGRDIDFKNSVVIMTTNAGTDLIAQMCSDGHQPSLVELKDALHEELLKTFKPAFLGRITVLPYFPLETSVLQQIATLKLNKVVQRTLEHHKAELVFTDGLILQLAKQCVSVDTGARKVDQVIEQNILPELSAELLSRNVEGQPVARVVVDWNDREGFVYEFEVDQEEVAAAEVEPASPAPPIESNDSAAWMPATNEV
ncbi:type VI secretion system ATPase TssH [Rosistilla oblonga]|uniref:Chaperone protein ClpB n=1 Tax=Rosistilla oblonga TaxID=2527990 RepID=A0A518IRR6_9BACT|nr:type VI secretion system ATPase TssH [Rosistilla oblonga]QDV55743.1 Chaperone protein ClpB [Rosistilla oblonga]